MCIRHVILTFHSKVALLTMSAVQAYRQNTRQLDNKTRLVYSLQVQVAQKYGGSSSGACHIRRFLLCQLRLVLGVVD